MQKKGKLERVEMYKERDTQVFLNKFLSGEISTLQPTFDPDFGYRYPAVESILGEKADSEKFLKRLYEAGFLKGSFMTE